MSDPQAQQSTAHKVVVIGSGFGGLFGTKALRKAPVDVTMVAKTTHHLFQPLLYQVATGILSEGEIAPPTREVLSGQKNAQVLLGEVTGVDLEARTVTSHVLGRETVSEYDSLIVAAGAAQSYFGNDHFSEYAPGMKSIDDALELRGRIFGAFELAEISDSEEEIERLLTFVVGDMISLDNLPGVAQVAIQGAKYAAKTIQGRVEGKAPQGPFKYFDKGSMATISRFSAVALVGKLRVTGFIAWLMWLGVHLIYLTGFKNRVTALLHWFVTFIGTGRAERVVTEQQIFARAALARLRRGAADLVSDPGIYDATRAMMEETRRQELEAAAQREAELTDSGVRGVSEAR